MPHDYYGSTSSRDYDDDRLREPGRRHRDRDEEEEEEEDRYGSSSRHHRSSHRHRHRRSRSRSRSRDRHHHHHRHSDRRRSRSRSRSRGRHGDTAAAAPAAPPQPQRSGIFQYIAAASGKGGAPPVAAQAAPALPEERYKPNAERLGSMIRGDDRMNRRMDERERRGAAERLRGMDDDRGRGHYGREEREGALIRDGFSKGVIDKVADKKKPYQCDVEGCEKSFAIAPDLSDHLKKAHDIHRHPSLISAKPVI